MKEAKHTPGPWATYVNKANDVVIRKMLPNGMECCEIARVKTGFSDSRLISAAPEMLEALNLCRQHMYEHASNTPDDAFEKLCAAIAKATGN